MRLAPGSRLGPYAIESALGAGGMGEVYRARDTRLDRRVAVKILGDAVAHDPQFRERFEREARAISALSHPHICTLFDVGQESDVPYLVMELLEGETLSERLKRGPLPLSQAFPIAMQIGAALAAAHRVGIIHRDLKPGNIMITRVRADSTGAPQVKLLDFGLARSVSRDSGGATTQVALTTAGETVGTIPYMSPEQLEGRPLDARSDIWSFGCVLYEMFAGRRPFAGDSDARLISQILTSEPAPITQASLDRVIRKCLAKDPEQRWQTAADLTDELQWMGREQTSGVAQPTPAAVTERPRQGRILALVAGVLALAALAFGAGYVLRPPPPQVPVTSFDVPPPFGTVWGDGLALSPDGSRLALTAITISTGLASIWIRDLDRVEARRLPGTDGAGYSLFWSPDGTSIGFFADGKLKTIRADGGPVIELADVGMPGGGTWNRDGVIVYSPDLFSNTGLWRVRANERKPVRMGTTPEDQTHRAPVFLPDGRRLLYVSPDGVLETSLDNPSQHKNVLTERTSVAFVAPGYLLFVRRQEGAQVHQLWAQRFDPDTLALSGEPVITDAAVEQNQPQFMYAFSATGSGVLAYRSAAAPAARQFVWVDREGVELSRLAVTGELEMPVLSPDGTRVAFAMEESGNRDLHVMDVASGRTQKLTFDKASDDSPVWSRDGQRLAFRRANPGQPVQIVEVSADGKGEETLLLAKDTCMGSANVYPRDYTVDGTLVYLAWSPGPVLNGGICLLPLAGDRSPRKWLDNTVNEVMSSLSWDNKWMAYVEQERSSRNVYVQQYPERGAKAQVSNPDGFAPQWRFDGRELFYVGPGNVLTALPMKDGASTGTADMLFKISPFSSYSGFAVTRDGQRFLVNKPAIGSDERTITVVRNWPLIVKK